MFSGADNLAIFRALQSSEKLLPFVLGHAIGSSFFLLSRRIGVTITTARTARPKITPRIRFCFMWLSLPLSNLEGWDSQRRNALAGRSMHKPATDSCFVYLNLKRRPLEFQSHSFPGDLAHVKPTLVGFPSECILGIIWKPYAQPIIQLNPRRFRILNLLDQ